jgi:hypothetical protein
MKLGYWLGGVGVLITGFVFALVCFQPRYFDRHYVTQQTLARAENIIHGCLAFRDNPQSGGKDPATLDELIRPPFGGASYARNMEEDLLDARGERFSYAVVTNTTGEATIYVWGNGRKVKPHLCGAMGRPDGTVVAFGPPE